MNIFLILVSVLLYALSLPKFNIWWLSFFSLTPLFIALDAADSRMKNLFYGVLWSAGFALSMGYWLFSTIFLHYEVPFARSVIFFTLCLVIPVILIYTGFAVFYRFLHQDRLFFYALVLPALWVLMEYSKAVIPFLIPWGGIEVGLVPFSEFVQVADVTGGYGIMFIAVAINALFAYSLKQFGALRKKKISVDGSPHGQRPRASVSGALIPLGIVFLLIGIPVVYGVNQLERFTGLLGNARKSEQWVHATLVQGNFSTKERWSGMGFYQRVLNYLEMSGDEGHPGERVVVWPETTLNSSSKLDDALFVEIMRHIGEQALLVSGGLKTDETHNRVFNSAYFISGTGRLLRYDKHILLPYSETSPLLDLLDAYYSAPNEFSAGRTPLCIDAPEGSVGASICFEILYPGFIRQSVKEGAQYLVNLSNDSWFGDSPMPYIHLNAACLRAIENRRFLLRTSNSGISAVISPTGKIAAQSRLFTKERVDGEFIKLDHLSFYARYGNLILFGSAIILLTALIRVIAGRDT